MERFFQVAQVLLGFFDKLEIFFFSPISDVLTQMPLDYWGLEGPLAEGFSFVFSRLNDWFFGRFGDYSLFTLFFGGAVLVTLVYKLVLFISPKSD